VLCQLYNKHEKNYNVTRKELLAVVTFVKKFRQYLLGKPFIIRSDHAALQWLKCTPEPTGQQARWLEILEKFEYTIQHRAGVKHGNADALSRRLPTEHDNLVAACRQLDPCRRCRRNKNDAVIPSDATEQNIVPAFNWVEIQKQDPDICFIYDLVATSARRPDHAKLCARSADIKTLCTLWDQLSITSTGILVRNKVIAGRPCQQQKVAPFAYRSDIAADMHGGLNGGHLGLKRAKHQLKQRFYWPGWAKDVELVQLRCERCSKLKRPANRRQGCLQPMLTGEPWERVGIDITGPHPTSSRGHIYILTLIDHFTKWIEIFPMRNQEASTVAKLLVDRVFCVHGLPLQILTDQGRNFESELFKEICRFLSVDKIRTTAYKPSTNGNIERFHATLNSMLAKLVSENQKDWDDKLAAVAFAYRNSVQESTGFSPYYLMYGREARIPADIVYGPPDAAHTP
jgi:transposase InsO family protein